MYIGLPAQETALANIILLHGASSAGKSSIAKALQEIMDTPFFHLSSDQLVDAKILPRVDRSGADSAFSWRRIRPRFFDGFHRSVRGFADAGNDLIVDHIIEMPSWLSDCAELFSGHTVFYVGVHCDLDELERRERARGDRKVGEARSHILEDKIHSFSAYDLEVDSGRLGAEACAAAIKEAYLKRGTDSVFAALRR